MDESLKCFCGGPGNLCFLGNHQYFPAVTTEYICCRKSANLITVLKIEILTTSIIGISFYSPNQLSKNKVTDEDGNLTIDFKNSEGKTVLLRKESASGKLDTYYIYNNYSQLAFVISPKAYFVTPSGGIYSEGELKPYDFTTNYVRFFRQLLGIEVVNVFRLAGQTVFGSENAILKAIENVVIDDQF